MKRIIVAVLAALALGWVMTACSISNDRISNPEGMCAYTVGNGNLQGGNRTVNKVVWPTQSADFQSDYDNARYFPCVNRNYEVSETSPDVNAGGQVLLQGRTSNNTPVFVNLVMYWQPNLQEGPLRQFITMCQKYSCSNDSPTLDSKGNFASDGWNGMLNENWHRTLEQLVKRNTPTFNDDMWITADQKQRDDLAAAISRDFGAEFQKVSGATTDLVCASVNSTDFKNFDCQNVRVVVKNVVPVDGNLAKSNSDAITQKRQTDLKNQQAADRIAVANTLYGPGLGQMALFCEDHPSATCVVGPAAVIVNK